MSNALEQIKALPAEAIERGWQETFSTRNPYCPCDLKSFTKAVRWAEHALQALRDEAIRPAPAAEAAPELQAPTGQPMRPWSDAERQELRKAIERVAELEAATPPSAPAECWQYRPGAPCLTPQSCRVNGCDVVEREQWPAEQASAPVPQEGVDAPRATLTITHETAADVLHRYLANAPDGDHWPPDRQRELRIEAMRNAVTNALEAAFAAGALPQIRPGYRHVVHELLTNIKRACVRGRNVASAEEASFIATCDHVESMAEQALGYFAAAPGAGVR